MNAQLTEIMRLITNLIRTGIVTEVDRKKWLCRVKVPGDYPADITLYEPATPYDKWNGERWVTDKTAQQEAEISAANATKAALVKIASEHIEPLQDAVDLGMATDDEKARFNAWRKYRVLLSRVDISTAPSITWPKSPA
mgnify:CR=1 FL=1